MTFYTLDRKRTLTQRQTVNLVRYTDINLKVLQKHLDMLFPDGVSSHGERYFVSSVPAVNFENRNIDGLLEIVFEYVRRANFPNKPSRFQSLFAFDSFEQAELFRQRPNNDGVIWEVECDNYFKVDMNLLTANDSILVLSCRANLYWSGKTINENPFWEYLLSPPISVIKSVA